MKSIVAISLAVGQIFAWPNMIFAASEAEQLRSELSELKQMLLKISSRIETVEKRLSAIDGKKPEGPVVIAREEEKPVAQEFRSGPKSGTVYGKKGYLLNPDVSVIANTNYFFRDGPNLEFGEFEEEELNISEVEIDLTAYLYPGIRGWTTIAYEPEEEEVEVEEAYVTFETLPWKSSATFGRRFVDFGLVNPIHQHFRHYTDTPLAVTQLFGEAFVDDGFLYSILLPTPGDLTAQVKAGIYDGRKELVEEEKEEDGLVFNGHVLQLGADINHPVGEDADVTLGYDVLLDDFDGDNLAVQAASAAFRYYFPESYQKILWQNEVYVVTRDEGEEPSGFYSYLCYTLNKYFDFGVRFDWTELLEESNDKTWAVVPSVTWNITESTYTRAQYRHIDADGREEADEFFLQFVFGFGPHSHRVQY